MTKNTLRKVRKFEAQKLHLPLVRLASRETVLASHLYAITAKEI